MFVEQPGLKRLYSRFHFVPVLIIFLLANGLMVSSALRKSATVDEASHLFRGVALWREGATHFVLGHPLFASTVAAIPVLTEPNLALPVNTPAWAAGDWSQAGDAFLWRLNDSPQRILFLGRLPNMWLTLLLLALVYRWGRVLAGREAGLFALLLLAFDPNLLAHGRFITGDLPQTLYFVLCLFGFWLWATRDARAGIGLAGIGLGLASVSKFSAGLLLPILGLLGLWLAWRRRSGRPIGVLFVVGVIGALVIWLTNGLALRPLPGGPFWRDFFWVLDYLGSTHGVYLAGDFSTTGWWYYFPVVFLLKTPLPVLVLLAGALLVGLWWRPATQYRLDAMILLLPSAIYFAASQLFAINIGYRYLLPILPLLWLFIAMTARAWRRAGGARQARLVRVAAGATTVWLVGQALLIWPDYVPFFNVLAGGPERSWRLLSDSNIDWGQDLPALAAWQAADGRRLKLSYFGTAHPSAYGVDFEPLPMWPPAPEQGQPAFQTYDPARPAPGLYALSVTSLHGVVLGEEAGAFAPFRARAPVARVGGSIFLYEVAATGDPVPIALIGLRPADFAPALRVALPSNDLQIRWLTSGEILLWPAGGGWLAQDAAPPVDPRLAPLLVEAETIIVAEGQRLQYLPNAPTLSWSGAADFGPLRLRGLSALADDDPNAIVVLTAWEVVAPSERPWQLFVHALDSDDMILGQWDGLDVRPESLRVGDTFVQLHRITHEPGTALARLRVGVYDAHTEARSGAPLDVPWPLATR